MTECVICAKPFTPYRPQQQCCGPDCRKRHVSAAALACTDAQRDVLLLAAGYTEGKMPRVMDFNLLLLDEALQDDRLPDEYRDAVRDGIAALLRGCEAVRGRQRIAVVRGERQAA